MSRNVEMWDDSKRNNTRQEIRKGGITVSNVEIWDDSKRNTLQEIRKGLLYRMWKYGRLKRKYTSRNQVNYCIKRPSPIFQSK